MQEQFKVQDAQEIILEIPILAALFFCGISNVLQQDGSRSFVKSGVPFYAMASAGITRFQIEIPQINF